MKKYETQNRRWFAGALVCIFLSTVFAVTLQFFKGDVLDSAVSGNFRKTLYSALLLISFILLETAYYYLFQRFSAKYAIGCISALRKDLFSSILRRPYVTFRNMSVGDYLSKFASDAETIRERRFRLLPMLWDILFRILLVSTALFLLDWRIAIITISLLTTPLYIPKLIESRLQNSQSAYLQAMEENLSKITDWLSGFEIIKNFSAEDRIRKQFSSINEDSMEKLLRDTNLGSLSQLISTLISYLSYFIVLVCATGLVLSGDFSAGDFFVAIGMIDQLSYPLISLSGITRQLVAVKPVCNAMEAFLNTPEDIPSSGQTISMRSCIAFRNVSFSYDGIHNILTGLDLKFEKGKRYLLRGPSGCGKTTAINLLLRYFEPTGGRIELDGIPLHHTGNIYSLMTVVRQEATLFHDTLRNNLTMYQRIPEDRLITALESVGLSPYAHKDALDRIVDPGGTNFSGGEKKRICLARTLLRNTEILILDEPLANLDEETARKIEDLILSIPDRTILVVSHQFSEEKLDSFHAVIDFSHP